jgi:predicted transcriptional regulator
MKSVLISIQPYWVFLIIAKAMGWNIEKEKTVEVRKNYPKAEVWDKTAKIYCSKNKNSFAMIPKEYQPLMQQFIGKVIGEFVCNEIECFTTDYRADEEQTDRVSVQSCLTWGDLFEYEYNSPCLFAWHISDLVIYDKPKELSEFKHWKKFDWWDYGHHTNKPQWELRSIERPPQSWCYVEKE